MFYNMILVLNNGGELGFFFIGDLILFFIMVGVLFLCLVFLVYEKIRFLLFLLYVIVGVKFEI